jgi:hypothetical protein
MGGQSRRSSHQGRKDDVVLGTPPAERKRFPTVRELDLNSMWRSHDGEPKPLVDIVAEKEVMLGANKYISQHDGWKKTIQTKYETEP